MASLRKGGVGPRGSEQGLISGGFQGSHAAAPKTAYVQVQYTETPTLAVSPSSRRSLLAQGLFASPASECLEGLLCLPSVGSVL